MVQRGYNPGINVPNLGEAHPNVITTIQQIIHRLGKLSSPEFKSLKLNGLTASRLVATDSSKTLVSSDLVSWVSGTTNQIAVADDSDGTITLSTPQDIDTACDFQANTIQLDAATWQIVDRLNIDAANYNLFLGTDVFNSDPGQDNVGIGYQAGYNNDASAGGYNGTLNVYIGYKAGFGDAGGSSGYANVGIGQSALEAISSGDQNFALGSSALRSLTTGNQNIGIGYSAGRALTTQDHCTFVGSYAGYDATGADLTGVGYNAIYQSSGNYNVGVGTSAGASLTTGSYNNCLGVRAGADNLTGSSNVAVGYQAGRGPGSYNVCVGTTSGTDQNGRSSVVLVGHQAGYALKAGPNVFIGRLSGRLCTTGTDNIFLGYASGYRQTTNSNLLIIDNQDRSSAANELVNSLIYGVFNASSANQSLRVNGYLIAKEAIKILERSSDPPQPAEGESVIWLSDGTGYGDDGDICAATTAGGTTKRAIIFDASAGDTWS